MRGEADRDLSAALGLLKQLQPALEQGNRARQNRIVSELVAMRAPMEDQWRALANLVLRNGEVTLARKAIELFVEAYGESPMAQYHKAALLEQAGALRDAYALMCGLPPDVPDPAANAYSRGTAALFLGETHEARAQLERATQLRPQSGAAWLSLAMAVDLADEAELGARILAAERAIASAPPQERAAYCYAKGKLHAERGDHQHAFEAFAEGARAMRAIERYDRESDRRNAEQSLEGFDRETVSAFARSRDGSGARTIFVTGSPRSGTTLVEQILASHSAVSDGGEIHRLPILAQEIRGHSGDALESHVAANGADGLGDLWTHLVGERFPGGGQVVDKSLSTTRFIGLAASLLPDAPLIWMTRDPLDCAWSCFRTFFPVSMPWSYDLEDIAHHFRLEDELLARWREILGERLLVVPYEELVAEPRTWIARILAHCGLAEEDAPFAPHESERMVGTASVMQVRKPINRSAVGAAEPYREYLEPFIAAYRG